MKNAYVKKIIKEFKNELPPVIFKCPLIGQIKIFKFPVRNKLFQMMPVGNYELKVDLFDVPSLLVLNVSMNFLQTLLPK
jgi:hypothetical protein